MTTATVEQTTQADAGVDKNATQAQAATPGAEIAREPVERKLATSAIGFGIVPRNLEEAWRFANVMAKSMFVPKDFQGQPENILVAMQLGAEVGLAPMASLQSIAVINGRPSIWGDGALGVVMAAPRYVRHEEHYEVDGKPVEGLEPAHLQKDTTAAVCRIWRKGDESPVIGRFTIGMAKKAGLFTKSGPWTQYPDRMLKMRARSWALRDGFADVLRGLSVAEEAQDITTIDVKAERVEAVKTDPLTELLESIASVDQRRAVVALFDSLQMNRGQRLVQLRAWKEHPDKLVDVLTGMLDAQKAEGGTEESARTTSGADASTPNPSSAPASSSPAPTSSTAPVTSAKPALVKPAQGKYEF